MLKNKLRKIIELETQLAQHESTKGNYDAWITELEARNLELLDSLEKIKHSAQKLRDLNKSKKAVTLEQFIESRQMSKGDHKLAPAEKEMVEKFEDIRNTLFKKDQPTAETVKELSLPDDSFHMKWETAIQTLRRSYLDEDIVFSDRSAFGALATSEEDTHPIDSSDKPSDTSTGIIGKANGKVKDETAQDLPQAQGSKSETASIGDKNKGKHKASEKDAPVTEKEVVSRDLHAISDRDKAKVKQQDQSNVDTKPSFSATSQVPPEQSSCTFDLFDADSDGKASFSSEELLRLARPTTSDQYYGSKNDGKNEEVGTGALVPKKKKKKKRRKKGRKE